MVDIAAMESYDMIKHPKRLLKLADYLEKRVENKKFDMGTWGSHVGDHDPKKDNFCGTTACAMGWATMIPSFQKLGLVGEWRPVHEDDCAGDEVKHSQMIHLFAKTGRAIVRDDAIGVAQRLFGITYKEAAHLFYYGGSRKEVVRHIREFVKQGGLPEESSDSTFEDGSYY